MSRIYPVKVGYTEGSEAPRKIGLFTPYGYWYPSFGGFEFDLDQIEMAERIVRAVNHAYEAGKLDARNEMRVALGLKEIDQ
jgi:hypothetical protein